MTISIENLNIDGGALFLGIALILVLWFNRK